MINAVLRQLLTVAIVSQTLNAPAFAKSVLRMGTIAPEGTYWAREFKAFARKIETATRGEVTVRWYFGGVTGDERTTVKRIRLGQLDGIAGGGFCESLAPSSRVTRVMGLLTNAADATYVLGRLRPQLEAEFAKSGFAFLGFVVFGSDVLFSRTPVRSLEDLRRGKYWVWTFDPVLRDQAPRMAINAVALPLEDAGDAFDVGMIDGFIAVPSVALSFRWTPKTHYFADLQAGVQTGCLTISQPAFDLLSFDEREVLKAATAEMAARLGIVSQQQDALLVGGLLERQGLIKVPVSDRFRRALLATAQTAGDQIADTTVPASLIRQVRSWLAARPEAIHAK